MCDIQNAIWMSSLSFSDSFTLFPEMAIQLNVKLGTAVSIQFVVLLAKCANPNLCWRFTLKISSDMVLNLTSSKNHLVFHQHT